MTIATRTRDFARTRRLRSSEALRGLVRETRLDPASFVYPLFVTEGSGIRQPIESRRACRRKSSPTAPRSTHSLRRCEDTRRGRRDG